MVYKVLITEEIDETLNNIDSYCIEHFKNYDYAQKVLNEILYVASFLSENARNSIVEEKKVCGFFQRKNVLPNGGYCLTGHFLIIFYLLR